MVPSHTADQPPSRIPWPPLLILAVILLGKALDAAAGAPFEVVKMIPFTGDAGFVIAALALANDLWCFRTLSLHETTIMPHRAVSSLVSDGPYRYSRNPIYISHIAVTFGLGLMLGSLGVLLLTPLLALALVKLSIEPEERHLERKFGDAFRAYAARTPRWL